MAPSLLIPLPVGNLLDPSLPLLPLPHWEMGNLLEVYPPVPPLLRKGRPLLKLNGWDRGKPEA